MFLWSSGRARTAGVAIAVAAGLSVSACGTLNGHGGPVAATARVLPDPLASRSGHQVAAEALANLKAVPTLTMTGIVSDAGVKYALDLALQPGHGCAGTLKYKRGTITLTVIGKTVYFKADEAFWKENGGSQASAIIAIIGGRYLKLPPGDKDAASFTALCDISRSMATGETTTSGDVDKGTLTTFHGIKVLPLKQAGDELIVTDARSPQVVEVLGGAGGFDAGTKLVFSLGVPVKLTAPPSRQVIDGSKLGQGSSGGGNSSSGGGPSFPALALSRPRRPCGPARPRPAA